MKTLVKELRTNTNGQNRIGNEFFQTNTSKKSNGFS